MKPLPSALISFSRRIGSPAEEGAAGDRARRPPRARPGLSARLMKPGGTASAGQGCQRRSPARNVWPSGRSPAATSTSLMATVVAGFGDRRRRWRRRSPAHHERGGASRENRDPEDCKAGWLHDGGIRTRRGCRRPRIPPAKRQIMVNRTYPSRSRRRADQAPTSGAPDRRVRIDDERREREGDAVGNAGLAIVQARTASPSAARNAAAAACAARGSRGSARRRRARHDQEVLDQVSKPSQSAVAAASLASPPPIQPKANRAKAARQDEARAAACRERLRRGSPPATANSRESRDERERQPVRNASSSGGRSRPRRP